MSDDAKLLEAASFFLRATAARIERDNLLVNDGAPHFASGAAIALPVHGRRVRVEVRVTIRTAPKHETPRPIGSPGRAKISAPTPKRDGGEARS